MTKQIVKPAKDTYCNPMALPNISIGDDNRMIRMPAMYNEIDRTLGPDPTYRSISDPTVLYHDGIWYLYPSYGGVWYTEDFKTWKNHKMDPYFTKYSPTITKWGDKFLLTSWMCPLYVGDSPLGPFKLLGKFKMPDGREFLECDPALFTDDDGRIYMYAHLFDQSYGGEGMHMGGTTGYELDREDPTKIIRGPITLYKMDPENNPWERFGYNNQDTRFGWIEGVHALKVGSRYYNIYATPGTQEGSYVMAVYYSDEGPLSGFKLQKKNPLTANKYGIVNGAGHGCVEKGPNNTLWAFYTIATNFSHPNERRIGMDLVAIDENGELYCPHGVTDTPQYAPGVMENPVECNSPGYLPLNIQYRPQVSSFVYGREAIYACDGSTITWWEPKEDDENPNIIVNLKVPYYVGAVRLFWQEIGICESEGRVPGVVKFTLEGSFKEGEWFPLCDNLDDDRDFNIDYRTFEPKTCLKVRLTIKDKPANIKIGVRDFTVFGVRDMEN